VTEKKERTAKFSPVKFPKSNNREEIASTSKRTNVKPVSSMKELLGQKKRQRSLSDSNSDTDVQYRSIKTHRGSEKVLSRSNVKMSSSDKSTSQERRRRRIKRSSSRSSVSVSENEHSKQFKSSDGHRNTAKRHEYSDRKRDRRSRSYSPRFFRRRSRSGSGHRVRTQTGRHGNRRDANYGSEKDVENEKRIDRHRSKDFRRKDRRRSPERDRYGNTRDRVRSDEGRGRRDRHLSGSDIRRKRSSRSTERNRGSKVRSKDQEQNRSRKVSGTVCDQESDSQDDIVSALFSDRTDLDDSTLSQQQHNRSSKSVKHSDDYQKRSPRECYVKLSDVRKRHRSSSSDESEKLSIPRNKRCRKQSFTIETDSESYELDDDINVHLGP